MSIPLVPCDDIFMSTDDFQRARTADQKAERIATILDAAAQHLDEDPDSRSLSLTVLARRAGMVKSNVYRYFESREAVLLALLSRDAADWAQGIAHDLDTVPLSLTAPERVQQAAAVLARQAAARPRLCQLISVLPSVLEHNVTAETVLTFKLDLLASQQHMVAALQARLPELPPEALVTLLHHGFALIIGHWPLANPAPVAATAMAHTALRTFQHHFEDDIRRAMTLMGLGLLAGQPYSGTQRL